MKTQDYTLTLADEDGTVIQQWTIPTIDGQPDYEDFGWALPDTADVEQEIARHQSRKAFRDA